MFASSLRFSLLGLVAACGLTRADDKPKPVELKVGDVAPTFQLRDDRDKMWSSSDRFGKKWVVVYFYPGDFTPGCTAQAKAFTAGMAKLIEKGVEVVGVSGDMVETHAKFKKAEKLNFTLLSDGHGSVARMFGVPFGKGATVKVRARPPAEAFEFERPGTAARWTFVVDPDGKVAYKNEKVTPADDARKIAAFIAAAPEKK